MTRPNRAFCLVVGTLFLSACMATVPEPIPGPQARGSNIRGVVVGSLEDGERVEFSRVDQVSWTETSLELIGVLKSGGGPPGSITTRSYPIADLGGVLVRQLDPDKTSIFIGGFMVGTIAVVALLVTGRTNQNTLLGISPF